MVRTGALGNSFLCSSNRNDFGLLRSIPSEHLIGEYTAELILVILEIIIEWLQVSVRGCNRQTPQTKIRFVSRDLIPSDRMTYTIASRVNFFDTKLSINQIFPQLSLTMKFEIYMYLQLSFVATNVFNTPT